MIEWLVRGPATEIGVHVDVLVRRYSTMLVAGSSVAHVTVALFDVADAFTAVIAGGVVSIGGGLPGDGVTDGREQRVQVDDVADGVVRARVHLNESRFS